MAREDYHVLLNSIVIKSSVLKRVDRLVLGELIEPFLFGLVSFSLLIVSATMLKPSIDFMIKFDLPFSLFLKMVALGLPQVIVLAIPMSILLGTLLAVGRLNNDSEVMALRAAGISLWRVAAPIFYFGVFITGVSFLLNELVVPASNSAVVEMKNEVILRRTGALKQENLFLPFYEAGALRFALYADELTGDRLSGVKFFHFGVSQEDDWWIYAASGSWMGDKWVFEDGKRFQLMEDGTVLTVKFVSWAIEELRLSASGIRQKAKSSLEMNIVELRAFIKELEREGNVKKARKNRVEYVFKFSTPFACVFFVLIAFPLAISPARTTGGSGMGFALLIVLIYYVVLMLSVRLGQAGSLAPIIAGWIPNGIVAAAGLYLFNLKNR